MKIKDAEVCADAGSLGASCVHTLSDETRDLSPSEWEEERFGMLCTKSSSFADWMSAIAKLCKVTKRCSYDTKKKIVTFTAKIKTFEEWNSDTKLGMVPLRQYVDEMSAIVDLESQFMKVELEEEEEKYIKSLNIQGEL